MDGEWDKVKESLKGPPSPDKQKEAADAFKKWQESKPKNSKPTLCSLGLNKPYPREIPLEKVPDEIERNKEFYKLMQRVVEKE